MSVNLSVRGLRPDIGGARKDVGQQVVQPTLSRRFVRRVVVGDPADAVTGTAEVLAVAVGDAARLGQPIDETGIAAAFLRYRGSRVAVPAGRTPARRASLLSDSAW